MGIESIVVVCTVGGVGLTALIVVWSLLTRIDNSVNKLRGDSNSRLDLIDVRLQELNKDVDRLQNHKHGRGQ